MEHRSSMPVLSSRRMQQLRDLLLANLTLVATLLASFAGAMLLHSFTTNLLVLSAVPLLAATIGVTAVAVALHPDVTCGSLGLGGKAFPGTIWGALLGAAACALAVVVSISLDWAAWTPVDPSMLRFDWREMRLGGLALLAIGAMGEELFMARIAAAILGALPGSCRRSHRDIDCLFRLALRKPGFHGRRSGQHGPLRCSLRFRSGAGTLTLARFRAPPRMECRSSCIRRQHFRHYNKAD